MKLYFLGGEDIKKRDSEEIDKKAVTDAGKLPTALIFPWTRVVERKEYRIVMSDYFKDLGAGKICFAELSDSFRKLKEKIESSDMIYLPGGDPVLLIEQIKKRKLVNLLKIYNRVIVGNSAGSLALCKQYTVIRGQDGKTKTRTKAGIGKVNFIVSVHYKSAVLRYSGYSPDTELKTLSRKKKIRIYAIPERCALVYDDKKISSIGDLYVFDKGRKVKI